MSTLSPTTISKQPQAKHHDEKILVVKREKLFPDGILQGLHKTDLNDYQHLIAHNKEFHWRSSMESDATYKQIIPYLIFSFGNKLFLMQRRSTASETRLKNKFSLGIGGHIREEDIVGKSLYEWAEREFKEEINYNGKLTIYPLGVLNDEANEVGRVHAGFVFLLKGDSDQIEVKEELKKGVLVSLDEALQFYDSMETWSKIALDFIKAHQQQLLG